MKEQKTLRNAAPRPLPPAIDHLLDALVARLLIDVPDADTKKLNASGRRNADGGYTGRDSGVGQHHAARVIASGKKCPATPNDRRENV